MNEKNTRDHRYPKNNSRQHKPKAWSHQHELTDLIGKTVKIVASGGSFKGELIAADQFTVKIDMKGINGFYHVVIFKSSMTYFCSLEKGDC